MTSDLVSILEIVLDWQIAIHWFKKNNIHKATEVETNIQIKQTM